MRIAFILHSKTIFSTCRKKVRDIEESLGKAKYQLAEMEARNQQQSREFSVYKDQQKTKPEVRLQSEMNLLLLEKVPI